MRSKILKGLAVISFGFITFPLIISNDALAFKNISVLRICGYYGIFAAVFMLGFILGKGTAQRKRLAVVHRAAGILSVTVGLVLLNFTRELNIILVVGISAVLWYFLGERAYKKHYADIFPVFMFGVYIVGTLLSYILFWAMGTEALKETILNAIVVSFMAELCLAALLINQSGIYDKANRRRETRTILPKGLSGYNAVLVLGITAAALALYVFADDIVWVLTRLASLILRAILFLMRGHSDFASTEDGKGWASGDGYTPAKSSSVWNVVFFLMLIVSVIVFRKRILNAIVSVLKRIYGFFSRRLPKSEAEPEFTDIFEEIGTSRRPKSEAAALSKLMKLYRNETEPIKKYRFGYALLLRQLKSCKAGIQGADTVHVHYDKGRALCGAALKEVTESYDRLRYNDCEITAEQLSALDKLISEMSSLIRRKK